jgi:hypothetical protein
MSCQDFEGTWVMKTHGDGYYEHELNVAVDSSCTVRGSWRHISDNGGQSSVYGQINNDYVELTRSGHHENQTFVGRWTPTFAGGTYGSVGVWFMEKR